MKIEILNIEHNESTREKNNILFFVKKKTERLFVLFKSTSFEV